MDDNELLATVADLARRAGADEPDRLARTLTLLLDDALSISSEHRITAPLRPRGKPHGSSSGSAPSAPKCLYRDFIPDPL